MAEPTEPKIKSIAQRLQADPAKYADYHEAAKHFEQVRHHEDLAAEFRDKKPSVKLKETSPVHTTAQEAKSLSETEEATSKALGKDYKLSDTTKKQLEELGELGHSRTNKLRGHVEKSGENISEAYKEARAEWAERLRKSPNDKALLEEGKALDEEFKLLQKHRADAGKVLAEKTTDLHKHTKIGSSAKTGLTEVGADIARNAEGKRLPLGVTKELAEEQWKSMGKWERAKTATAYAWENSGGLKKTMRVLGTGVGVIIGVKGVKDFVAPGVDENGQPKERDMGTLFKSLAEVGIGGTVAYFSLAGGGKGHALGK